MLLITSIMNNGNKEDLENQKNAIKSWIAIGFEILSANTKEEILQLRDVFSEITFVELKRTGMQQYGKPIPYIYDMLQILLKYTNKEMEICGIINSDIILRNISEKQIKALFRNESNRLICCHRYDIDNINDFCGKYYFSGIDVFFMLRKNIYLFKDCGFALSKPEWDHWMVYTALKNQMSFYEIKNAVAFHVKHTQRWTPIESNLLGMKQGKGNGHSQGEEYYSLTNNALANISNRISLYFGNSENDLLIDDDSCTLFYEEDILQLASKAMNEHGINAIMFQLGIGYQNKEKQFRICNYHGRLGMKKELCIYKRDTDKSRALKLGEVLAYIDISKLEIIKRLNRFYLYPAGRGAKMMLECLLRNGKKPLGLVDKDPDLALTHYLEIPIYSPEILTNIEAYEHILIISNLYVDEIYNELSKAVPKEKLIII